MTVLTRHIELTIVPKLGLPIIINSEALALFQPQIYINFQLEKQHSLNAFTDGRLDIYNLNDISAGALDFREDLQNTFFLALE